MVERMYNGLIVRGAAASEATEMFYDEKTVDLYAQDVMNNPKGILAIMWVNPAIEQSKLSEIVSECLACARGRGDRKNG